MQVLDPNDMQVLRNWGQTSGHSFGNSLHTSKNGKTFLGADMGDNYPRGINLFSFSKGTRKRSKVAYTFKTKHCTDGKCYGKNVKLYKEISTPKQKFYTQSNDNEVWKNPHTPQTLQCVCMYTKRTNCHQSHPADIVQ